MKTPYLIQNYSLKKTFSLIFFLIFIVSFSQNIFAQNKNIWKWQYKSANAGSILYFKQYKDGIIYAEEINNNQQSFLAIDARNGLVKWRTVLQKQLKDSFYSLLEKLDFSTDTLNLLTRDSQLFVLDASGGKLLWKGESNPEIGADFLNFKSDSKNIFVFGNEIGLRKNDAQTGLERWQFKRCLNFSYSDQSNNRLIVKGNTVVFPCGSGKIYAIDAETGKEKWRVNYGRGEINYLFEADGNIYTIIDLNNNLSALIQSIDLETGKKNWEDEIPNTGKVHLNAFTADRDSCFFYNNNFLIRYDAKTGKKLWTKNNRSHWNSLDRVILAKSLVINTNSDGSITATSLINGQELWKTSIIQNDDYDSSERKLNVKNLEVVGNIIYVKADEELFAFDLSGGKLLWKIKTLAELKGSDTLGNLFFEREHSVFAAINTIELKKYASSNKPSLFPREFENSNQNSRTGVGYGSGNGGGNNFRNIPPPNRQVSLIGIEDGKAYYLERFIKQKQVNLNEINLENGKQRNIFRGIEVDYLNQPRIVGNIIYLNGIFSRETSKTIAKISYSENQPKDTHQLWAIDLKNGELLWKFDASLRTDSKIVANDNGVFFLSSNNTLYALDNTGKLLWKQLFTNKYLLNEPKLLSSANKIYLCFNESGVTKISAFEPQTGNVLWTIEKKYNVGNLWANENLLYFSDYNGNLFAVDGQTGKEAWKESFHLSISNLKIIGENLYTTSIYNGWLTSLNRKSGELNWERKFEGEKIDFADENELLGFRDKWILNAKTGERKQKFSYSFKNSGIILDGNKEFIIFLESKDGQTAENGHPSEPHLDLIKFDIKSNKILWSVAL